MVQSCFLAQKNHSNNIISKGDFKAMHCSGIKTLFCNNITNVYKQTNPFLYKKIANAT